ncbi:MAG: sigma-70 family RNA polymerase sigma factor [Actinomycetota bacterium]
MRGVTSAGTDPQIESESNTNGRRFDEIYRSHRPSLVTYASKRGSQDPELMADLALLDGYRALDRMRSDHPRAMWAYLYKALNSHMIRERAKPRPELRADLDLLDAADAFEETVIGDLDLHSALAMLPEGQEQALRLRLVDDKSAAEIGRELGKSPAAVRQLQHQGLRRLRRLLYAALVVALLAIAAATGLLGGRDSRPIDFSPATSVPNPDSERRSADTSVPGDADIDGDEVGQPRLGTAVATADGPGETSSVSAPTSTTLPDVPAPPPVRLIAYDGFDVGVADGAQLTSLRGGREALGFAADWQIEAGTLDAWYDATGLDYTDGTGFALQTTPGALRLKSSTLWSNLVRPLAEPGDPAEPFWVGYLIRVETQQAGDAFWFSGHGTPGAGVGIQTEPQFGIVNGPRSTVPVESQVARLVVARISAERTDLWIDPDLSTPGPPIVTTDEPGSLRDAAHGFAIFNYVDAVYTIDEYRLGAAFADVAPRR